MDVYLLRHGKAEDPVPETGDPGRKLTKKGREDIAAAGRFMKSQDLWFDRIAASPLVRAQETAAIIADALDEKDRLVTWKVLAPGGDPDAVCRMIGRHPDTGSILLVGHEPLLSSLISRIIAGEGNAAIAMAKGSLARIRGFTFTENPSGELHSLVTVKQMTGAK